MGEYKIDKIEAFQINNPMEWEELRGLIESERKLEIKKMCIRAEWRRRKNMSKIDSLEEAKIKCEDKIYELEKFIKATKAKASEKEELKYENAVKHLDNIRLGLAKHWAVDSLLVEILTLYNKYPYMLEDE